MYSQQEIYKNQITKDKIVKACEELIDKNLVWNIKPNMSYMACDIESPFGNGSIYVTAKGIESNFKFVEGGSSARQLALQIDQVKSLLQEQFDKCKEMLNANAKEEKPSKLSFFINETIRGSAKHEKHYHHGSRQGR